MNTLKTLTISTALLAACSSDPEESPNGDAGADMTSEIDVGETDLGMQADTDTSEPDTSAMDMGTTNPTGPNDVVDCALEVTGAGDQNLWVISTDPEDNLLITGGFQGQIDFGDGPRTSAGDSDAFLGKIRPDCSVAWIQTWTGPGFDRSNDVTVLSDGSMLATGSFTNSMMLGDLALTAMGSGTPVIKLDSDGELAWAKAIDGARLGNRVEATLNGEAILQVQRSDGADFGSGAIAGDGSSILWLDADGEVQRGVHWMGDVDSIHDIETNSTGQVAAIGQVFGPADVGNGVMLEPEGGVDITLAVYEADGTLRWSRLIGGPNDELSGNMQMDDDGSIYVGGAYTGDIDFGDGPVAFIGGKDAFVAKYDPDGNLDWLTTFGGPGEDWALSVTAASADRLGVTGAFQATATIGDHTFEALGLHDQWTAAIDRETGDILWSRSHGTTADDFSSALFHSGGSDYWLSTDFLGALEFGGTAYESSTTSFIITRISIDEDW